LNNLGTTLELKKEHNKAKACFAKAIKLSPHFEDALLNLSAVYYNEKETDSAYLTIARISDTTNDVRYDKFLTAILWKKINEFSNEIDDRQLRNSIIRIRNDNAWMKKVFLKSKKKQNDIERQLLIEAVYLMESVDSTITDKEAEKLKIKYHLQE
jgi:tetratricopeptide (TPR) repeat protein